MNRFLANSKGYSIPELVVVLSIMGILASTAVPNYSRWALKRQVDGQAKKLSLELQLARISAIKNNNNVRVTFNNPAVNQYTIHNDINGDTFVNGVETVKTVPLIPRVQFGFFGALVGVNGNNVTNPVFLANGGTTLTFNPRGQASDTGSVYLTPVSEAAQSNILLRGVSVLQATGNIEYWEFISATNTWQ